MGDVRIIRRGPVRCDQCNFSAKLEEFPVHNEQFTCPKCKADESALIFHPSLGTKMETVRREKSYKKRSN